MTLSRADALYLRAVSRSWRLYRHASGSITLHSEHGSLRVPVRNRIGHQWSAWDAEGEPRVRLVRRLHEVNPGAVVDVGANVGLYCASVLLAGRGIRYIGAEPNIVCAEYIRELIQLNDAATTATVLPVGFSDRSGAVSFYLASESDVSATTVAIFRELPPGAVRETVAVLPGDDALRGFALDAVSLIKVDVEGAELEALRGLGGTIASHRPALVVEVLPHAHNAALPAESVEYRRRRASELTALLRGSGYGALHMTGGGLRPVGTLERGADRNWRESDFLCVPLERWKAYAGALGFSAAAVALD